MDELKELETWVENNRETLQGRSLQEIAELAVTVGFGRPIVNAWKISESFKAA